MVLLFPKPEDRVSCVEAKIIASILYIEVWLVCTTLTMK